MDTALLDVPPGYTVAGFEITGRIASGGWGTVYAGRACDDHRREVALKFIPRAGADKEVHYALTADHPSLIRTFGAHVITGGTVVLVMERAQGTLADAKHHDPEEVLRSICQGLAHLHRRKIVHGDLKPSNVLFVDGRTALADFGLSTEVEGSHGYGPRLGSVDYMPPEWWSEPLGEHGARIRPAHDVWAFGVIAYRVLGGAGWPFPGQTPRARALNAAAGAAPSLDRLPPAWRDIVRDCLEPRHADRPSSASVLTRIEAMRGGKPARRGRWLAAAAVVVTAVAAAGVVAVLPERGDRVSAAERPGAPIAMMSADRVSSDGLLVGAGIPTQYWGTVRRDEHIAVTDVTGDGRPDVLLARTGPAGTDVLMWSGKALNTEGRTVLHTTDPMRALGVAGGDVTGDGHGDLVAYHRDASGAAEVAVWPGGPDGLSPTGIIVFTNSFTMTNAKLAVGDVTGDGTADIVLARAQGDAMTLHLIVGGPRLGGSGNTAAQVDRRLATSEIAVADVTGDGYADVLIRSRDAAGGGELNVVEGNPAGFAERVLTPMRANPEHSGSMIIATDVTGDGVPDAVLGRPFPDAGAVQLSRLAGGGRTLGPDEMLLVVGLSRLLI